MPRAIGLVVTAATDEVDIAATTYNEQTSGAQRSVKSADAGDAAAGTGIRTLRIVYYALSAGVITGPFVEVLTMNGTTAVPTVATNIALIEKMEAVTVGSGGGAAGAITLYANAAGGSTAIAQIGQSFNRTFLAHHYVPSNRRCHISDVQAFGGNATAALTSLKRKAIPSANQADLVVSGPYITSATVPAVAPLPDAPYSPIPGPCRLHMQVTPGNNTSQMTLASFGFYED